MALSVKEQSFLEGDAIVRRGEKGDVFYVITEGSVSVQKESETLATLGIHDFFGERALLSLETRTATCIVASSSVTCHDFVLLLGNWQDLVSSVHCQTLPSVAGCEVHVLFNGLASGRGTDGSFAKEREI
eukprot:CAMPEP_0183728670 /NCGR_PEP_ID=MMETSP0737-20130205/28631_1 /TAXON_ID=385413 /ORGANISM="Thalassiosira miniscula, Strain CCMP1093" /LENGTH=129 /DNA_ID=CAMNT_0025960675 /DNA_START=335 /DNA_END=724 /DNA_ORIENTATION=-